MKDLYLVDGYNMIFGRPDIFDRNDLGSLSLSRLPYIPFRSGLPHSSR